MEQQLSIPRWNSQGVLPPALSATGTFRSPYAVSSLQLVERFATTKERCKILGGFFRYREALHSAGIVSGFQWLDGSFMEQVEVTENRAPRDIDVVSFLDLSQHDQQQLITKYLYLFAPNQARQDFYVDAYIVELNSKLDKQLTSRITYWYSMWSHRRDGLWKGFLQLDLQPDMDAEAIELLSQVEVTL